MAGAGRGNSRQVWARRTIRGRSARVDGQSPEERAVDGIRDWFRDIEDAIGRACAILIAHGHPASEVERYSWPAIEIHLDALIEKHGGKVDKGKNRPAEKAIGENMVVRPMDSARLMKNMGVTDPKLLEM